MATKAKLKKEEPQISPEIRERMEALAQFLSQETLKGNNAQNLSCWDIFYHYNREFNAIALAIGYNLESEKNEDWTGIKLINEQLTLVEGYQGKSRSWLQQCRRILRIASEIYGKCVASNALDELDLRKFSYEHCRLISTSSIPFSDKKEVWEWMERESPGISAVRAKLAQKKDAYNYLEPHKDEEGENEEDTVISLKEPDSYLETIASEVISLVQSGEILESEKLVQEIAMRLKRKK